MKDWLNSLKNRVKENFIKNKVLLLIFLVIWVITITITLINYGPTLGKESVGNEDSDYVIEVDENTEINEVCPIVEDGESVAIRFATYARKNSGNVSVKVVGNDDEYVYAEEEIKASSLNDNAFKTIKLNKNLNSKDNKNITITISSDSKNGSGVGMYYSENKCFDGSSFAINNKTYDGDVTIRFLKSSGVFNTFYMNVIIRTIIALTALILFILLIDPPYHVLFPVLIFVVGMIFVFVISPMSPPDEQFHYECTLQMSNAVLNPGVKHTIVDSAYTDYSGFFGHYNTSLSYSRIVQELNKQFELTNVTYELENDISERYWLCYIPHFIGFTIARVFNCSFYWMFLSGRIAGLIFYCVCLYIALKNAPTGKLMIGTICSMPMFIQTAISYTYDTYLICLAVLVLSFFLKWSVNEDKISWKEYIFVLVCCAGLAPLKFIYGFIALIFLFVPSSRFIKNWVKWPAVLGLIVAGLIVIVPILFNRIVKYSDDFINSFNTEEVSENVDDTTEDIDTGVVVTEEDDGTAIYEDSYDIEINEKDYNSDNELNDTETGESDVEDYDSNENEGVSVGELSQQEEYKTFEDIYSTKYVFTHPMETAKIFLRTVRYSIKTWFYASLGRTLSGSTLVLNVNIVHLLAIIALAASIRGDLYAPKVSMKIVLVGICIIVGLLMMAGFFVTWTDASQIVVDDFGGIMVQGIQGRYFCPLLPYFFMVFNNKKLKFNEKYDKCLIFALLLVLFEIVVYIMSYTFVV